MPLEKGVEPIPNGAVELYEEENSVQNILFKNLIQCSI